MIGLTYEQIRDKIVHNSEISEAELKEKVSVKMDQLSGLISQEGAAHIIANELGIKLFKTEGDLKINDVMPGMRTVDLTAKIVKKYDLRTFNTNGREGKVASMIIGDETGILRVALWNDQADKFAHLKEGDILKLSNTMVRNNQGKIELHLNASSKLALNPDGVKIETKQMTGTRKKLSELSENDQNVEVLGTIVQVYDLRFWEVCSECNKRAQQKDGLWYCATHQQINPDYNYVLNTFVDDGTDSLRVTFWKKQIQHLLEKSDEEIQKFRTDPAAFEPLKTELLGNIVKLVGNTRKNEQMNNLEFTANMVFKNPDPKEELDSTKETVAEAPAPKVEETPVVQETVAPVVEEVPVVEQKPTPETIAFETPKVEETPVQEKIDKTGIDEDLVSIEDLDDLEELDDM